MKKKSLLALALALVLLMSACGEAAPAPQETPLPQPPEETPEAAQPAADEISVGTVDELLAAIGPGKNICLRTGIYDLSTASDYGRAYDYGYYSWTDCYDGFELVIRGARNMRLRADGAVTISAVPRYADVLSLDRCEGVCLQGLSLGHTTEPGLCAGGVLDLIQCRDIEVENCLLFGCGVMGLSAEDCDAVTLRATQINQCSYGAVSAAACRDVRLEDCRVTDNGNKGDYICDMLFEVRSCDGFALVNCEVSGNHCSQLLHGEYSRELWLLGTELSGNRVENSFFFLGSTQPVIDKCHFDNPACPGFYELGDKGLYAVSPEGEELISFDLRRMQREHAEYEGPREAKLQRVGGTKLPDGTMEYRVSTAEELVSALGSDTTVILEAGEYDLSAAAASTVGFGGANARWENAYDGPMLVIEGVKNLRLIGAGEGKTRIVTRPRGAAVLKFTDCSDLSIQSLTAGHTEMATACEGDVLIFERCEGVELYRCGLFGCGVWGVYGLNSEDILLTDCDIYECSAGGLLLVGCGNTRMSGVVVRDCDGGSNLIWSDRDFIFDGYVQQPGNYLYYDGGLWNPEYDEYGNVTPGAFG